MNELDRMELSRGEDRSAWQPARRVHDGVRRWTGHALAMYEAAFPAGATELLPAAAWDYRYRPADGGATPQASASRHGGGTSSRRTAGSGSCGSP
ncbi:hypothetical protein ACFQ2M_31295 [Kitasatospora saccharophila]|uniref:hypothetical protein n=1 Tax=Kitasatospora saccharophila TaxID=407973 RepID=UPI0036372578